VDVNSNVSESNENNNNIVVLVTCNQTAPVFKPDYIPLVFPSPITAQVNTAFNVMITTKNIGPGNATNWSVTRAKFLSTTKDFSVQPLNSGQQQDNTTSFTCPASAGNYTLNVTVDYYSQINESNENNNNMLVMVGCTSTPPALKPDYVPIIPPAISAYAGQAFNITITTKNIGPGNATNWSVTRAKFLSTTKDFGVQPLNSGQQQSNPTSFDCPTAPGVYPLNATVDFYNQVNESNESNNNATTLVDCQQQNPNMRIECALVNHGPYFFPGDYSWVAANCTGGAGVGCPALIWNTTITNASLSPNQTAPGPSPVLSLFSVSPSAVPPQNGTINIACADQGCSATCSVALNVSQVPTSCTLAFEPPRSPYVFTTFDSSLVNATCFRGVARMPCPPFAWTTTVLGATLAPPTTLSGWAPQSNFSTGNSVSSGGNIKATSTLASVPINCTLAPISVADEIGPNYIIPRMDLSSTLVNPGQTVTVTVHVRNNGNMNATNYTITRVFGNCPVQDRRLRPLNVNEEVADSSFTCACTEGMPQTVKVDATANLWRQLNQTETSYNDNNATRSFTCRTVVQMTCPDFV
jgi:hypothetical protein